MPVETQAFYHPLPRFGTPLNQQWDEFRADFNALAPLVRAAEVDIAALSGSHDLAFFDYGKLDFRNKWRAGYDRTLQGYVIQWNSATEASPTWNDVVLIRDSDRRVVITGDGGLESETGFYNLGSFLDSFYLVVRGSLRQKKVFANREAGLVFDSVFFYLDNLSNPDEILVTLTPSGSGGETNTASNLGSGEGVFANKLGVDLRFRSLTATSPVSVSSTATEINIASSAEANTASNLGSGEGWFSAKSGVDLQFKSATAGEGITLTSTATEVQIRSTVGKFYGVIFKESESGGRVEQDDTLVFDSSSGFYLTQAGNDRKPLLSFEDHVTSVSAASSGDETLVASDTATGAGHAIVLKKLTAGSNITFTVDANQISIAAAASGSGGGGFYGVIFKESEAGGRIERDDTIVFDSAFFYLTQAGNDGKPLLSARDAIITFAESESGGYSKTSSKVKFDSGYFYLSSGGDGAPVVSFTGDLPSIVGGRLTLSSNTPVMTSDATAATTIYYTPYTGDRVSLFDGSDWKLHSFAQLSQSTTDNTKSPAAVANNSNYDLFVWNDAGVLRCTRGPAWSGDNSRGTGAGTTELVRLNGVLVNKFAVTNGPAALRGKYVGSVRSNGSAQIDWDLGGSAAGGQPALLYVWNNYNRVATTPIVKDSTASWTYSTNTTRPSNNSTSNRISLIVGQVEQIIHAHFSCGFSITAGANAGVAIGLNSTTTATDPWAVSSNGSTTQLYTSTTLTPSVGQNYIQALENSLQSGDASYFGVVAGANTFALMATIEM